MKIKSLGTNITEVETGDLRILVSYSTPVAAIRLNPFSHPSSPASIKTDKFWSVTTSKHINQWLESWNCKPGETPKIEQEYFDQLLE